MGQVLTADRNLYIARHDGSLVGPGLPDSEAYLLAARGHLIPADVVVRHRLSLDDKGRIQQGGAPGPEEAGKHREPDMDAEKGGENRAADPDKRAALEAADEDPKFGDAAAGAPKNIPEPKSPGGHGAEIAEKTEKVLEETGENRIYPAPAKGGPSASSPAPSMAPVHTETARRGTEPAPTTKAPASPDK